MARSETTTVPPRSPSRSAMLTAVARALHRAESPPWVLDDPLAARLAGEGGAAIMDRARAVMSPLQLLAFCRWVCVRGRIAEDLVAEGFADGIRQYVILGAGLDSFAYRRPEELAGLHVFEVDEPSSQAWKRQRLREIAVPEPPELVFAPVDFERETLDGGLRSAGFDFNAPAVFSWMGVTMYLTVDAIRSTLQAVASSASGSRLVLTYNLPPDATDDYSQGVTSRLQEVVAASGEPFVSLFTSVEIEDLVADAGFARIRHVGREEATHKYFSGRDVALAGAQRILIAEIA